MKRFTKLATAAAISGMAVVGLGIPAQAAPLTAASCHSTTETCRVTLTSFSGGFVAFSTNFPGVSGPSSYTINEGTSGPALCSGSMGFNTTESCTTSYSGEISFIFGNKEQNGTISIAA